MTRVWAKSLHWGYIPGSVLIPLTGISTNKFTALANQRKNSGNGKSISTNCNKELNKI